MATSPQTSERLALKLSRSYLAHLLTNPQRISAMRHKARYSRMSPRPRLQVSGLRHSRRAAHGIRARPVARRAARGIRASSIAGLPGHGSRVQPGRRPGSCVQAPRAAWSRLPRAARQEARFSRAALFDRKKFTSTDNGICLSFRKAQQDHRILRQDERIYVAGG